MALFRDQIFPKVAQLTAPGGKYDGYLPVYQGDNAGPHIDNTFHKFVTNHCREKGWRWEPQAPQMPHMNNLDLAVFPAMSKRHSVLLRNYSNTMAPREDIWKTAQAVWSDLESYAIARGYLLAYRIASKVIAYKGDNTFLQQQDFHSGIRSDFSNTDWGCVKKVQVLE
jgi:hypothetical protein